MRLRMRFAGVGLAALATAGGLVAVPSVASASYVAAQVSTRGSGATVRDCYHPRQTPSTACGSVAFLNPGTSVRIICQKYGQSVTGAYGTSDVWDYVVVDRNGQHIEGFAADTNIYNRCERHLHRLLLVGLPYSDGCPTGIAYIS